MINEAYQVLQTLVNKEQDGYVSPAEFNQLAKLVQDSIFEDTFSQSNRDQNRENKGLTNPGYGNIPSQMRERVSPFMAATTVAQAGGVYPLPADLYYIEEDGLVTSTGRPIELVEHYKRFHLVGSLAAPDDQFPVAYRIGDNLTVLPSTYTTDVTIQYIRRPNDPVWAYQSVGGDPVYDQSNSVDFELHPSEFTNIVMRMLAHFGITLREGEVIQVAEALKQGEQVKDNN